MVNAASAMQAEALLTGGQTNHVIDHCLLRFQPPQPREVEGLGSRALGPRPLSQ